MDMAAYRRLGTGCVARRHELDYLAPSFVSEELMLGTWIHENDFRLPMWRAYQVIRVADRRTLLRGKTLWVSVDLASGKPRRMPAEFVAVYRPLSESPQPPF
jgi:acyl-CoA thioester hydrolase